MIPLLRVEWTLLLRHRIALSTVIVAGLWAVVVAVAPPRHRVELARWAITVDVAALGFFFAPALAVIERQHGVPALLRLTRARPDAIVAARALSMVFVSLSAVLILDVVARMPDPGLRFLGAGTMAALGSLAAWWVVGTSDSFTRFVGRIPLVVGPVVAPAIADATGWWSSG